MNETMSDKEMLTLVGMTTEQAEDNARTAESETLDDGLKGHVYHGLHFMPEREEAMTTISVRMPESLAKKLERNARQYHISRSEYIRRKLQDA